MDNEGKYGVLSADPTHSQVPHHRRAPHLHGHDRLLQDADPPTYASPVVDVEVRSCWYGAFTLLHSPTITRDYSRRRIEERMGEKGGWVGQRREERIKMEANEKQSVRRFSSSSKARASAHKPPASQQIHQRSRAK